MRLNKKTWIGVTLLVTTYIGVRLLLIASRLHDEAVAREHTHNWVPLTLPVSLVPGTIRTPDITTHFNGDYEIVIEFEKMSLHHTGTHRYHDSCRAIPSLETQTPHDPLTCL